MCVQANQHLAIKQRFYIYILRLVKVKQQNLCHITAFSLLSKSQKFFCLHIYLFNKQTDFFQQYICWNTWGFYNKILLMISGFLLHIHVKKNHYSEIRIYNLIWLLFPVQKSKSTFYLLLTYSCLVKLFVQSTSWARQNLLLWHRVQKT